MLPQFCHMEQCNITHFCSVNTSTMEPFSSRCTGKSERAGCLWSLKDGHGLSKFGITMMMGRMLSLSSGHLPSCNSSISMSWFNPRG